MDFFDSDKSYLKTAKIIKAQLYDTITQQNPLNPSPPFKKQNGKAAIILSSWNVKCVVFGYNLK